MAFVYLLCDTGQDNTFKIGVTRKTIEKRIKQLQTGNGSEIILSAYYETEYPYYFERMLHQKFNSDKKMGEWFDVKENIIQDFKEECKRLEDLIEVMKDNPFFVKGLK